MNFQYQESVPINPTFTILQVWNNFQSLQIKRTPSHMNLMKNTWLKCSSICAHIQTLKDKSATFVSNSKISKSNIPIISQKMIIVNGYKPLNYICLNSWSRATPPNLSKALKALKPKSKLENSHASIYSNVSTLLILRFGSSTKI